MTGITAAKLQDLTPQICEIAKKAGKVIRQKFHSGKYDVEYKEDGSPVTSADYESHAYLYEAISGLTPGISIISEENETQPDIQDGELFWAYDPLDGTQNFVDGKETFYVKIALIENGAPVLGVIYVPMSDTLYYSWKEGPSFMQAPGKDPEILRAKTLDDNEKPTIVNKGKYTARPSFNASVKRMGERGIEIDTAQSVAGEDTPDYMCIAAGKADIYINCGRLETLQAGNGFSWDYAPDILIVENAGGHIEQIHDGSAPSIMPPTEPMNAMIAYSCPQALSPK